MAGEALVTFWNASQKSQGIIGHYLAKIRREVEVVATTFSVSI